MLFIHTYTHRQQQSSKVDDRRGQVCQSDEETDRETNFKVTIICRYIFFSVHFTGIKFYGARHLMIFMMVCSQYLIFTSINPLRTVVTNM